MTLRASYLLSEHYDQISPTSTRINNNINNESGSKNWVDLETCKKKQVFSGLRGTPFSKQVCRLCHTDIIDFANHKANIETEVLLF